jgi:hypothetical protein
MKQPKGVPNTNPTTNNTTTPTRNTQIKRLQIAWAIAATPPAFAASTAELFSATFCAGCSSVDSLCPYGPQLSFSYLLVSSLIVQGGPSLQKDISGHPPRSQRLPSPAKQPLPITEQPPPSTIPTLFPHSRYPSNPKIVSTAQGMPSSYILGAFDFWPETNGIFIAIRITHSFSNITCYNHTCKPYSLNGSFAWQSSILCNFWNRTWPSRHNIDISGRNSVSLIFRTSHSPPCTFQSAPAPASIPSPCSSPCT